MPFNDGDILEVVTVGAQSDQQVLNVYTYQILAVTTSLSETLFAEAFIDELGDLIRAVSTPALVYNSVRVRNLTNPLYEGSVVWGQAGTISGGSAPPFVTMPFRLQRANTSVRNGRKSYGGVPESAIENNGAPVQAGYVTALNALGTALVNPLAIESGEAQVGSAQLVIVGRLPNGGYDLNRWADVVGYSFSYASTQNTRKIGRGN